MLDGAIIIPLQSLFWNLIFELAALLWIVDRALLNVGYFIMVFTRWVTEQAFAPLLGIIGDQTGVLVGPLFSIAMLVLGFTYMMAVFGKFEVVNFRSAVMWLLIAAMLYTFGPGLYLGMEDFRRLFAGGFYEAGIDAFNDADTASGLSAIGTTAGDTIAPPVDRFGPFLGGGPGASAVDGLDVAMAYVGADGYRVRVRAPDFDETVFSGTAPQWGEGGFELALGSAPLARDYTIQLFSPQGQTLSETYLVSTRADCAQNVALLAFVTRSR